MMDSTQLDETTMDDTDAGTQTPQHSGKPLGTTRPIKETVLAYFTDIAPQLLRPAEGILSHPSIIFTLPGSQYSRARWDWDTLWTAQGLIRCANLAGDEQLKKDVAEHAKGSLLNFLDRQADDGRIPIMVSTDDPDPFNCLKPADELPNHRNHAKPIFGQLALSIAEDGDDWEWVAPILDKLLAFYATWTEHNMSPIGLYVWGDDVAIGNDNDPATFGRPFFSSANLLLNTLFNVDLKATATLARKLGRDEDADRLETQATALGEKIVEHCWDERDKFFYTVDTQCVDMREELIKYPRGMDMSWQALPLKVQSFTGFLPMWCGLATQEQAQKLVDANLLADDRFTCEWGIRSLSSMESMYELNFSSNPSNWLGPVWVLINQMVWKALKNYGFDAEAEELATKTLTMLASDIEGNGYVSEFYHPDTGKPIGHKAYMDWNLLALDMI